MLASKSLETQGTPPCCACRGDGKHQRASRSSRVHGKRNSGEIGKTETKLLSHLTQRILERICQVGKAFAGVGISSETLIEAKPKRKESQQWNQDILVPHCLGPRVFRRCLQIFRYQPVASHHEEECPRQILKDFDQTCEDIAHVSMEECWRCGR